MKVKRRINAILFLNNDWKDSWGGFHKQWQPCDENHWQILENKSDWKCIRMIKSIFSRLLVFRTNNFSWHGHTQLLNVPEGNSRKSLITYYYPVSGPSNDLLFDDPHRA